MKGKHFITLTDFSTSEVQDILELAVKLKREHISGKKHKLLDGKCLAMIFEKPSNRTRISFEVGMHQLGGKALIVGPSEINMGKREPICDVARVLSRFVDGVVMRVFAHESITELAAHSTVPVINGLSDLHHPCQAVSDMLTILEHKDRLEGVRLTYIGDGNNVCNSLMHASNILGLEMTVSSPEGYEPENSSKPENGGNFKLIRNPKEAVKDADVVYTDTWTSMGQEEESAIRLKRFRNYTVTEELFSLAKPDAIFMHCLPAHRGEEVVNEVMEHSRSVIFDQAENRLHAQKAILALLL